MFYNEVLDTVRNGIVNKVNPDNLVLEINASKYVEHVYNNEKRSRIVILCIQPEKPQSGRKLWSFTGLLRVCHQVASSL